MSYHDVSRKVGGSHGVTASKGKTKQGANSIVTIAIVYTVSISSLKVHTLMGLTWVLQLRPADLASVVVHS